METLKTLVGSPLQLGATIKEGGANFALFSKNATQVSLLVYDKETDHQPSFQIVLDPKINRTGDIWHIFVTGVGHGTLYNYQINGSLNMLSGHRFDATIPLIDPYAKALSGNFEWAFTSAKARPKAIVIDGKFDWQGDQPLNYPLAECILYEAHVKGLTQKLDKMNAGSYLGIIEMIPYLKDLGITSLELLPVHEFDDDEYAHKGTENQPMKNYWGYSTMAFFAPKARYTHSLNKSGDQVVEFKTMVRELHKAGIEVILDVVYNHTHEGNEQGPVVSFKGIDNSIYYTLYEDKRYYWNYSGCGNTLNCNHRVVRDLIIDSLRYWVSEMHVDGFRFDLASILTRDEHGHIMSNAPLIEAICSDPILMHTKMIAEPWDAGGGYQVGSFPGVSIAEWNDRFRDDVRRYWRNDGNMAGAMATRLSGSQELYAHAGKKPYHSINYVTAHDGFTLHDLVTYTYKNNWANHQHNTDGSDNNLSWHCGIEGLTDDESVNSLRLRQMKNFLATLLLSQGTPMVLGGDEFARTQQGNNNGYCQDNELSWYDWQRLDQYKDLHGFTKDLIALRRQSALFGRVDFFSGQVPSKGNWPDIIWFGCDGHARKWHQDGNILGVRLSGEKATTQGTKDESDVIMLLNPTPGSVKFNLPVMAHHEQWLVKIDTASSESNGFFKKGVQPEVQSSCYTVQAHSMVVLQLK